ncbi:D-aminoacyl-tRNA deacylase [Arthrobacter halodurans]|uniref:D-aminoacyl-tRNA deacylase n=1 Tax=Arthrobacter halodurans TaxID=516699 RepID=A0ABV4UL89_9MICC
MKAVAQRVSRASVSVDGRIVGRIDGPGLLVLLGVHRDDGPGEAAKLAEKIWHLRMLADEQSCHAAGAPLLVVSQFTLYGDVRKGRRPSWTAAAGRDLSEPLYEEFVRCLRTLGAAVETGAFGEAMEVSLVNSGPFTLIVDTSDLP